MFELPRLNFRRDQPKALDHLISVQQTEKNFSLTIQHCPEEVQKKLNALQLLFKTTENQTIIICGMEMYIDTLLQLLNKTMNEISTTRRLELLCELKTLSGKIIYPVIDNEDIEVIKHPKINAHFILRIQTRFLAGKAQNEVTPEAIEEFCNTLFIGMHETNKHSETFSASQEYRISGHAKFISIQGSRTGIEGALQRLLLIHRCIDPQKAAVLQKELGTTLASPLTRSSYRKL